MNAGPHRPVPDPGPSMAWSISVSGLGTVIGQPSPWGESPDPCQATSAFIDRIWRRCLAGDQVLIDGIPGLAFTWQQVGGVAVTNARKQDAAIDLLPHQVRPNV